MKRKIAIACSALMLAMSATALVGCKKEEDKAGRVMNVSLNPEVEFVLDADDKVVSVNALNEEGNLVISAAAFENVEGKSAEEAAKLFVQVSKENGFLFEGSIQSGENKIEIAFSGEDAAALYNDVKSSVTAYLNESGVAATIEQAAAITEEHLRQLVEDCAPYFEAAEVQAMEYAQLVATIAESRKETAEMYSQELKNAYYEAKAFAMEKAELTELKSHLNALAQLGFDTAFIVYEKAVTTIEDLRDTMLVNEDSPYQLALQAFREAKTNYLNYRNYVATLEQNEWTTAVSERLAEYQSLVDTTEEALLSAGVNANDMLDTAKAQVKTAYDRVVDFLESASVKASAYLDEISTAQKAAQEEFFTNFETQYAEAKAAAEQHWAEMSAQLQSEAEEN